MNLRPAIKSGLIITLSLYLAAAGLAYGLKKHYSQAAPRDLAYILAPTALCAKAVGGLDPAWEEGAGYVDRQKRIAIAPACAGVNFLIIAFAVAVIPHLSRGAGAAKKILWLPLALFAAYLSTIVVNTLRILIAVRLYQSGLSLGWLTPDRLHRLAGVLVYLPMLYLFHLAVRRAAAAYFSRPEGQTSTLFSSLFPVPLLCYLSMTLVLPLANGALAANPALFLEHALFVAAGSGAVCGLIAIARAAGQRRQPGHS